MPRPSVSDTAMTGVRPASVPHTPLAHRSFAPAARPTGAAESNGGITPSLLSSSCRPSMPTGGRRCPIISKTALPVRPCVRLSNSMSPTSRRSSLRGGSTVIEQRDGPTTLGRDDARSRLSVPAASRLDHAAMRDKRAEYAIFRLASGRPSTQAYCTPHHPRPSGSVRSKRRVRSNAELGVLHAIVTPRIRTRFMACNLPARWATWRAFHIVRHDNAP